MDTQKVISEYDALCANNKFDEAEDYMMDAVKSAMTENDFGSMIIFLNEIIGLCRETAQFAKGKVFAAALENALNSLNISNEPSGATSFLNIANFYRSEGSFDLSESYYKKVLDIYKKNNIEKELYAALYNNIALLLQEEGKYEKSVEYLKKALELDKEIDDFKIETANSYVNLAVSLLHLGQTNEAKKNACLAKDIFESEKTPDYHYGSCLCAIGDILTVEGKNEEAVTYYEKALKWLYERTGYTKNYSRVLDNLRQCCRAIGKENALNGINLSFSYWEENKDTFIKDAPCSFTAGVFGEGSDCYGYDDELSCDHDFGAGFIILLEDKNYEKHSDYFKEKYSCLPKFYKGFPKLENRRGVYKLSDYVKYYTGLEDLPQNESDWTYLFQNENGISALINGKIFYDTDGKFETIRSFYKNYYPKDLKYKLLANYLALAAQSGQYNYIRAVLRKNAPQARYHLFEFCNNVIKILYVLNEKYRPHSKWYFKEMENFNVLPELAGKINDVMSAIPDEKQYQGRDSFEWFEKVNTKDFAALKINEIAEKIVEYLNNNGLTCSKDNYLDVQSKEVLKLAEKEEMIKKIIEIEWKMFDRVQNLGGRAECQDDLNTFTIMRRSQYLAWNENLLKSYLNDLETAKTVGRNLIQEKYARMEMYTVPKEYEKIKDLLPKYDENLIPIIDQIAEIQVGWMEEFSKKYPKMAQNARTIHSSDDAADDTSYETYLKGELMTYSVNTLMLYGKFIAETAIENKNLAFEIMTNTAVLYGYKSCDEAEKQI